MCCHSQPQCTRQIVNHTYPIYGRSQVVREIRADTTVTYYFQYISHAFTHTALSGHACAKLHLSTFIAYVSTVYYTILQIQPFQINEWVEEYKKHQNGKVKCIDATLSVARRLPCFDRGEYYTCTCTVAVDIGRLETFVLLLSPTII